MNVQPEASIGIAEVVRESLSEKDIREEILESWSESQAVT